MSSPLSEIWFSRKPQCMRCPNLRTQTGSGGNTVMRCAAVTWSDTKRSKIMVERTGNEPPFNLLPYCIDARDTGQPCGPAAKLFKEMK